MQPVWKEPPSIDKITDKLYLGNECGAHNQEMLTKLGITHILVAGNYLHQKFPKNYKYLKLPLIDRPKQDLFAHLQDAFDYIDSGEKVLVHCAGGMSRSASIVIAYVMVKNKWKYEETYKFLKEKRPIVCPNEGFVTQLKQLEEMIEKEDLDLARFSMRFLSKKL